MSSDEPSGGQQLVPIGNQVAQNNNKAGGHMAAGDVNTLEIHVEGDLNLPLYHSKDTALSRLYKRLVSEAKGDEQLTEYIGQLQIFTRLVEDETVVGLDSKLLASDRVDQLDMAKAMKELVYGELRKNMFSKTFQTIYATLMGKIHEEFQTWVRPAIARGADREEIDQLVNIYVVKPIVAELEMCPDHDGAPIATVRGMIYFLTGNCHLRWH
ncbi:MAG: hypothetical protein JWN71_2880 [Xanthobacteraceae bacterium]|nr:hypothetical protein [Xanthobacteraceae bacterium]